MHASRSWLRAFRAGLLCALLAGAPLATAQDAQATRERLEALAQEIEAITRQQREDEARRGELQQALRRAETRLADVQTRIAETETAIADSGQRLDDLAARREALSEQRDRQREQIARDLRQAWQLGQQAPLKVLLNQERPQTLARVSTYYRYIYEARRERLSAFRATLDELSDVVAEALAARQALNRQRETLAAEREALAAAGRERTQALARLNADMAARGESLAQLEKDREELEALLENIEAAVRDMQIPDNAQPFAQRRGAMPWPVAGPRRNSFGRPRNEGRMVWHGINIAADRGTSVQAIHHGRVVYADWLRGSGLLLVLDHGDGYMSLYAHNATLLRQVGDWVSTGTPIATVGDSGGREDPGLYFEIRHQGKPIDPAAWCQR
jgi:septal ring factor EnvC (AmiA/AmiB activator)